MIKNVNDKNKKEQITKTILEDLTEWFGIEEYRMDYIKSSKNRIYFAYMLDQTPLGFIMLKENTKETVEIDCMGVLKNHHGQGIGKALVEKVFDYAKKQGYHLMQVKTVAFGVYKNYDQTNLFYQALGFQQLEVFPTLWDKHNPCLIYVRALS